MKTPTSPRMDLPEIVDFARNFAVMVRVQGPDPKGVKMHKHAFHQYVSGKTSLSASGMLLPEALVDAEVVKRILGPDVGQSLALVVTVASVIEPFLTLKHRESISQGQPELIAGAHVDVLIEGEMSEVKLPEVGMDKGASRWVAAELIRLANVPISAMALQALVETSSGSLDHGWEVGWSLASHDNGRQSFVDAIQMQTEHGSKPLLDGQRNLAIGEYGYPSSMGQSTTRIAILGVSSYVKDVPNVALSPLSTRGDLLLAVGSPFGILSPVHFFNSMSAGSVANCYPPRSPSISLLMADIRCLPGMEGCPVFGVYARLIGMLIRPLRQKSTGAEIQLVIPWEAIATACSDLLLKEPQNAEKGSHINKGKLNAVGNAYSHTSDGRLNYTDSKLNSYFHSSLSVKKALASICLITIDESVWASGVLLNDQGLILTNAHLLEPWRFGKTSVYGGSYGAKFEESVFPRYSEVDGCQTTLSLSPQAPKRVDSSTSDENKGYKLMLPYRGHRNIRVRLDHVEPWIWCDAKIMYVCSGSLDVALLQLEHIPDQLQPIKVDFSCPPLGSKMHVIGHGLFGPRGGFAPTVCSGVVAKVVKAKAPPYYQSIHGEDSCIPAMLETTAAVHPGGSGGAVINSEGHMIGLVTSNARHSGGTVIPHLNFSIPCAVLAPIFEFARDMQDISLVQNLDKPNEHLSSVWALMPQLSPKPNPPFPNLPQSLLEDNDKQGKGSRFAKFLADRDKVLGSTRPGNVESNSNKMVHSKL